MLTPPGVVARQTVARLQHHGEIRSFARAGWIHFGSTLVLRRPLMA